MVHIKFTFPNGLPEEMNPLKSRPKHKGIPKTIGEESGTRNPLLSMWEGVGGENCQTI